MMLTIDSKRVNLNEEYYYLIYKDFRKDIHFEKRLTTEDLNILHKQINEIFEGGCKEATINIKEVLEKDPYIYIAVINDKINNVHKVVGVFSTEKLARESLKKYAHYDTQVIKKELI